MAIHVDPNKSARRTTSRLCFSQECPVIYRNFSRIIFLTIPGPFPTIPDHNTVRLTDNHPCEKTYINAFALFVPTSSAALGIAFKASLMLCSHLHEQSGHRSTGFVGCAVFYLSFVVKRGRTSLFYLYLSFFLLRLWGKCNNLNHLFDFWQLMSEKICNFAHRVFVMPAGRGHRADRSAQRGTMHRGSGNDRTHL